MRSLFPFLALFKYAPTRLLLGLILMIVGLSASIGLLTLSGWFLAAAAIASVTLSFNFFYPSAGVRGLAIGRTLARYFERVVTHDATFQILAKLRVTIFSKIIPLSPAVLNRYRNSELLNRLVADVDTLDTLYLRLIAPFISALCLIIFLVIGLQFIDVDIALFLGGSLLTLLLLMPTIFYQLGRRFGEKLTQSRALYRVLFIEYIQAQAELLLFNAEINNRNKLQNTEQQWQSYQSKEATLTGLSSAILLFLNGMIVVITLWLAADAPLIEGDYRLAQVALLTFSALASFEILMPIGAAFLHLGQVIASAERVNDVIQQQPLVIFNGTQEKVNISSSQPVFQLQNVYFSYPNSSQEALKAIDLSLYAKQKIAILGKTGSGKSSLLQLLVRNYEAQKGHILLAQQPIAAYTEDCLRETVCLLTQRVHIFSDTLANNLRLANSNATEQQLVEVLHKVGLSYLLHHSTEQAEDLGLDLWLGEGGRPLSGGEQRRLGIARLLLSNAPIILLDEPTEGLDRETERQILDILLTDCADKTIVMVTHRLTALEQFDCICVIDNNELVQQGSYQQLSQQEGLFRNLLNRV